MTAVLALSAIGFLTGRRCHVMAVALLTLFVCAAFVGKAAFSMTFGLRDGLYLVADLTAMQTGYVLGALSAIVAPTGERDA